MGNNKKKDRVKKAGDQVKRVFDHGADRITRIRKAMQSAGGYTPVELAKDMAEAWTDGLDLVASFLGGGGSPHTVVVLNAPVAAYNAPGGALVTEDGVSVDDALDSTLVLSASHLGLAGGTDNIPFDRVTVTIDENGWAIRVKVISKQKAADPSVAAGVYLGAIHSPPDVLHGFIQLWLS